MSTSTPSLIELMGGQHAPKRWREREIALSVLGRLSAIEAGQLDPTEACRQYFTMDNLAAIRRQRLATELRDLFEACMELEDLEQLMPAQTRKAVKALKQQALALVDDAGGGQHASVRRSA
ncbi:MAG: DUF3969 family protein [Planctomycetes bacterium]|jgi:hypothetical protein|nr:DUF3969 family protein [Planctomycetota bacterium]